MNILLAVPIMFFILGQGLADSCIEDMDSTALLQTKAELRSLQTENIQHIALVQEPGNSLLVDTAADKINATMTQMHKAWAEEGFWGRGHVMSHSPGCGEATPEELQMTIPGWQQRHPGVRSFCHFSNFGFWFPEVQSPDYRLFALQSTWADKPSKGSICESFGAVGGPEVAIKYDGLSFTWNHARDCSDIVDDPYCYTMGWLKGQNLDGAVMKNKTAWHLLAKSECQKIQDEFQFVDEEATVGRHVESTPIYFSRTWCALTGRCPAVTRRIHKEHTYAKCQLGADSGEYAATEMAYCYYKACVLPGKRIGHSNECDY
eukprot:TRINITY_DN3376_c0_g1_i9.p1 TRINITY_DN3376_c0_g1~~TRINITY_DN3376_c0_g1_i9.p1  ORF type:complete len:318 (+),score=43.13 TRINITY_DN3376_c0_g1_i9:83-1036(+)